MAARKKAGKKKASIVNDFVYERRYSRNFDTWDLRHQRASLVQVQEDRNHEKGTIGAHICEDVLEALDLFAGLDAKKYPETFNAAVSLLRLERFELEQKLNAVQAIISALETEMEGN